MTTPENRDSSFPPEGFHTEKMESPLGPMDIIVKNEGLPLRINLNLVGISDPRQKIDRSDTLEK